MSAEYNNPLMVELMVPRDAEAAPRIQGFYQEIGWVATMDAESEFLTYVHPDIEEGVAPTVAYWQTPNEAKTRFFTPNDEDFPSTYARGLRLPHLQELVEVCLVLPSDEEVERLYMLGGSMLEDHAHTPLREHAGRSEFRFADPFNYSLRVTANPGWEIAKQKGPLSEFVMPEFVSLIPSEGGEDVPLVTRGNLRAFSARTLGSTSMGERTFRSLERDQGTFLSEFLVLDEYQRLVGCKPDKLQDLVAFIDKHQDDICLRNYGTKSGKLLLELHQALYTGEITEYQESPSPLDLD